jgi:hypothetical protein
MNVIINNKNENTNLMNKTIKIRNEILNLMKYL